LDFGRNGLTQTITMIDYGGSNLRSVQKAFEAVGAAVVVSADPETIRRAPRLVLPGVGAFGAGISALRARGLEPAIQEAVKRGAPLLGICLGMQFLFTESHEMGRHPGLALLPGQVLRFPTNPPHDPGSLRTPHSALRTPHSALRTLKIPHMGWNQIEHDESHPLLHGVPSGAHTYFVHSYYCEPEQAEDVLAWTQYGLSFAAIVGRENVFGIQFHPEKSQKRGLQILRNFSAL
jgi:imidazole glycerol-phosphate synthase subunit HisH